MYLRATVEIIAALFAVFGLYSAVRLITQKLFGSEKIFLVVEIKERADAENAYMLIREAMSAFLVTSSCRVAVIVSPELSENETLLRAVELWGVEYYIAEKE
ncbi:MAG: hypothetical protein J6A83_06940 [Clostridia bacterium]|nr:hypothetical protein [Clostridia bacterium]